MLSRVFALVAVAGLLTACSVAPPAQASVSWGSVSSVYQPTGAPDGSGNRLYYGYAPSVVVTGSTRHVFTCHNSQSGVVKDDIYGTTFNSGSPVSDASVVSGTSGWSSFHNCDPSVIRVDSLYGGVSYAYAMFFLGNDVNSSSHNQVGVAYSQSLDGPWVKNATPVIAFTGSDTNQWGAGQPSATTVNADTGQALLFWVEGYGSTTTTYRAEVDLDGAGGPVIGTKTPVTTAGLTGSDGAGDWLNDADFAYDPSRDRFYAVREQHPYPADEPNYIGSSVQVVSISGASIWNGGGTWSVEGAITPALTGFARNHNAGIVRTEYGTLPDPATLGIVFTTSCGGCSGSLWQYALHEVDGWLG